MYLSPKPGDRKRTAWLRGKKSWDEYQASKGSGPVPSKKAVFAAKAEASSALDPESEAEPKKSWLIEFLRKKGIRL